MKTFLFVSLICIVYFSVMFFLGKWAGGKNHTVVDSATGVHGKANSAIMDSGSIGNMKDITSNGDLIVKGDSVKLGGALLTSVNAFPYTEDPNVIVIVGLDTYPSDTTIMREVDKNIILVRITKHKIHIAR